MIVGCGSRHFPRTEAYLSLFLPSFLTHTRTHSFSFSLSLIIGEGSYLPERVSATVAIYVRPFCHNNTPKCLARLYFVTELSSIASLSRLMSNGRSRGFFLLRIFLLRVYAERSKGRGRGGGGGGSASLGVDRCRYQTHHAARTTFILHANHISPAIATRTPPVRRASLFY